MHVVADRALNRRCSVCREIDDAPIALLFLYIGIAWDAVQAGSKQARRGADTRHQCPHDPAKDTALSAGVAGRLVSDVARHRRLPA
jgi:hypothetical protein